MLNNKVTPILAIFSIGIIFYSKGCQDIPLLDVQNAFLASKAAYLDNYTVGSDIANPGEPMTGFIIKHISSGLVQQHHDDIGVKVFIAENKMDTIVAFRGSFGNQQLVKQVQTLITNMHGTEVKFNGIETRVNTFFWSAFDTLYKKIKFYLRNPRRKYILTGHSLGGAMASLLAIQKASDGGEIWEHTSSSLITFGQPRVGDDAYAKLHDHLVNMNRKLRFILDRDPIPYFPLSPATHHSREVWMTSLQIWDKSPFKKIWMLCEPYESLKCSILPGLPNPGQHLIVAYEKVIMSPPSLFQDMFSRRHGSWIEGLRSSCEV